MKTARINFDKLDWDTNSSGVRINKYSEHGKQLHLVEIKPGSVEANWCEVGHISYILEDGLKANINGTTKIFSLGDGLIISSGKKYRHKSKAVKGTVQLVLIDDL